MPAGLAVYNIDGVIQIDETYKNPYLISTGTIAASEGELPVPVNLTALGINPATEMPVVLLKPAAMDKWFGGCRVYRNNTSGIWYFETATSEVATDYAIFSTQGTPIKDEPGNIGMQVFDAAGSLIFDTNYRHLRLISSQFRAAVNGYNYPMNITISGFSEMPWVVSTPLCMTWKGVGSEGPDPLGVYMKINSNTSATVEMCYLELQEDTAYNIILASQGGQPNAVANTQDAINAQDPYFNRSLSVDFAAWA